MTTSSSAASTLGFLSLMIGGLIVLSACAPARIPQRPPTVYSTGANTKETWERTGMGEPRNIGHRIFIYDTSNAAFQEVDIDEKDPQSVQFTAIVSSLRALESNNDPVHRAQILNQARTDFTGIMSTTKDEVIKLSALVNVTLCDMALGDRASFVAHQALLPKERDRTSKANVAVDSVGLIFGGTDVKKDTIMASHANLKCAPPNNGATVEPETLITPVYRVVSPAVEPVFSFVEGTAQTMKFPSIEATLNTPYDVKQAKRLTISVSMKNVSQRVVELKHMAIRLTHNQRITTYRTVDGEYRLLPGDTTPISLRLEKGDEDNFDETLGAASTGVSTFTVYDVPTVFDDLGNVTKKENLTWKFSYTPGAVAVSEIDKDKSTVRWATYLRGVNRLPQ